MTSSMMEYIPLKLAYLCQDCNSVGNCSVQCPGCASSALLSLSAVLDRNPMPESFQVLNEAYSSALAA